MTAQKSIKKLPAIFTACLFGMYGFVAGGSIGFGVDMDFLPNIVIFRMSAFLLIFTTFCGLLICRRFWAGRDLIWLAILALTPSIGFCVGLQPATPMASQLIALELPIVATGLLSLAFFRWRDKRSEVRGLSSQR